MLGTRYEEYVNFTDNIPFVISFDITRSKSIRSNAVNWHDNVEIQLCTSGSGFVLLDGKKININVGDVVVANSNTFHYTGTDDTITYDCMIIDTEFCKQAGIDVSKILFKEHFYDNEIREIFGEIKVIKQNGDHLSSAKLRMLTLKLLVALCEKHTVSFNVVENKKSTHKTIKDTIIYIHKNYNRKLSLDEIAKSVYANKFTLTRAFKEMTGQTIFEYINIFRCRQAHQLINSGFSVSESAILCGFSNMSFFTKTFKRYIGYLPSECQK